MPDGAAMEGESRREIRRAFGRWRPPWREAPRNSGGCSLGRRRSSVSRFRHPRGFTSQNSWRLSWPTTSSSSRVPARLCPVGGPVLRGAAAQQRAPTPVGGAGYPGQGHLGGSRSLSRRGAWQRARIPLQEQFLSFSPGRSLASKRSPREGGAGTSVMKIRANIWMGSIRLSLMAGALMLADPRAPSAHLSEAVGQARFSPRIPQRAKGLSPWQTIRDDRRFHRNEGLKGADHQGFGDWQLDGQGHAGKNLRDHAR